MKKWVSPQVYTLQLAATQTGYNIDTNATQLLQSSSFDNNPKFDNRSSFETTTPAAVTIVTDASTQREQAEWLPFSLSSQVEIS